MHLRVINKPVSFYFQYIICGYSRLYGASIRMQRSGTSQDSKRTIRQIRPISNGRYTLKTNHSKI